MHLLYVPARFTNARRTGRLELFLLASSETTGSMKGLHYPSCSVQPAGRAARAAPVVCSGEDLRDVLDQETSSNMSCS
jgi:hypothetical protein